MKVVQKWDITFSVWEELCPPDPLLFWLHHFGNPPKFFLPTPLYNHMHTLYSCLHIYVSSIAILCTTSCRECMASEILGTSLSRLHMH